MKINREQLQLLRGSVVRGALTPPATVLHLIDYAIACESLHDDEQIAIENEHASLKFMRGLLIAGVISGVAQYYFFKWLFLSSGWF